MLAHYMVYSKNVQFTQLIKAGGRLREFNFRKSEGLQDPLVTVDVASENGERYYLKFKLMNSEWILQNKITIPWIEEILPQIEDLIAAYR